jgi:hypothetical protein
VKHGWKKEDYADGCTNDMSVIVFVKSGIWKLRERRRGHPLYLVE